MLNTAEQTTLLSLAKQTILDQVQGREGLAINPEDYSQNLRDQGCCFVTLHKQTSSQRQELRGCIGALEPYQPLILDVIEHAEAAAFRDPRFPPLGPEEYPLLEIEISVLNKPQSINFSSEDDLLNQINPGIDGLILEDGLNRGTFLPSVWESLPNPLEFWQNLKNKAGFNSDYWSDTLTVKRYSVQKFGGKTTTSKDHKTVKPNY